MTEKKLRTVFMGTPDFAAATLDALAASGHEVICVYTQPPKPAGRGNKLRKSPVHLRAGELGIEVRTPKSLKKSEDAQRDFAALGADIAVVAAYGLILPKAVLDAPKHGCINVHASLLPRWRGAGPIQRAIMAGDAQTGVTIMQMEEGLDTGPMLLKREIPITDATTASGLHDALAELGARMTVEVMDMIAKGAPPQPELQNDDEATYAHMLSREDGRIDWRGDARDIERQLRALTPWPGVWCMAGDMRLKVHAAEIVDGFGMAGEILDKSLTVACGEGALRLTEIQPEGKKRMDGAAWLNGAPLNIGDTLT